MSGTTTRLLTPAEASDRLAVPRTTLTDWRYKGIGPAYVRLGPRQIRYPADALEAWIAENTVTTAGR